MQKHFPVNPLYGNISHLLVPTYPTVHLPYSMLRVLIEAEREVNMIQSIYGCLSKVRRSGSQKTTTMKTTDGRIGGMYHTILPKRHH